MLLRRCAIPVALFACLLALSAETPNPTPIDVTSQAAQELFSSQDPFDRIAGEATLRGLTSMGMVDVCLAPGTPPEVGDSLLRTLPTYIDEVGPGMLGYYLRSRWTLTANGTTGTTGNPIILTWSIVPDGTDADGGPSDLYAVFNAAWGGTGWITKIRNAFALWHAVTGITYVEVTDDGASLPDNPGLLGFRGDVRLSGRYIDGPGNVLAYNYYPNTGDMVMDTGDVAYYSNPIYNYGNLRNTVSHEHGHGIGLGHVIPTDCTKLMEPYSCSPSNFVGPQDDDIRGGMRDYGDPYENNDTNTTPSLLGTFADSLVVRNLSIDNGNTDVDWYRVTLPAPHIRVDVYPVGSSYSVGPDGGTETWVATDSIADLDIDLYDAAGTTLIASATSGGLGQAEELSMSVPAGDYQVKVYRKAGSGNQVQRYTMVVHSDAAAGVLASADFSFGVYPNPLAERATARFLAAQPGPYRLEVFDVTGRACRSITGRSTSAGWVEAVWDGRNDRGADVPAGVYFMRVSQAGKAETARVVLVR